MTKRRVLTSVVASTVLASVLVLSGCGGSNNGKKAAGGLQGGEKAETIITDIIADKSGNTNSKKDILSSGGDNVGSALVNRTYNIDGSAACQDPCSITIIQETSCPDRPVVDANPVLRYHKNYGDAALDYAWANKDTVFSSDVVYDPKTMMVVFGGALLVSSPDIPNADITLNIEGLECGLEVRTETAEGFANPGTNVFALVKTIDADGNDVGTDEWIQMVTMDENGNFTLDLDGLDLGADSQIEVLLFSIKEGTVPGSTGMSGANS